MKFAQLLFSPTGGTKKVAEAITGAWEAEVETLDLTDPAVPSAVFQTEDLVLIAVPSYGGRVPPLALQRLEQIQGGRGLLRSGLRLRKPGLRGYANRDAGLHGEPRLSCHSRRCRRGGALHPAPIRSRTA